MLKDISKRQRDKIDGKIQFAAFAGYVGLQANGHRLADVSVRLYRSFSDHRLAALIRIFFGDCASYFTTTYFSSLSYGQRPAEFSISLVVALSLRPSSPTFLPFPSLPFPIFPSPPFVLRSRSLFFPFFYFFFGVSFDVRSTFPPPRVLFRFHPGPRRLYTSPYWTIRRSGIRTKARLAHRAWKGSKMRTRYECDSDVASFGCSVRYCGRCSCDLSLRSFVQLTWRYSECANVRYISLMDTIKILFAVISATEKFHSEKAVYLSEFIIERKTITRRIFVKIRRIGLSIKFAIITPFDLFDSCENFSIKFVDRACQATNQRHKADI